MTNTPLPAFDPTAYKMRGERISKELTANQPAHMWYDKPPERGYWELPERVVRYRNIIQAMPQEWQPPTWLNRDDIENAYNVLKYKNAGRPEWEWEALAPDDPNSATLALMQPPPNEALWAYEQKYAKPTAAQQTANQFYKPMELADMPNPAKGGLSDEQYAQLPGWQKGVIQLMSSPLPMAIMAGTTGAALGAGAGSLFGPVGTVIGGVAGFATAAAGGYQAMQNPEGTAAKAFNAFDKPFQEMYKWLGIGSQFLYSIENPERYGSLSELMENYDAVKEAARAYDMQLGASVVGMPLFNLASILEESGGKFWELTPEERERITAGAGEEWLIGQVDPATGLPYTMPVQTYEPGETLGDVQVRVRNEIITGQKSALQAWQDAEAQTGMGGAFGNLVLGILTDPIDRIPGVAKFGFNKYATTVGNKWLGFAAQNTRGPREALSLYGTMLRDYYTKADWQDASGFQRFVANVDKAGTFKELSTAGSTNPLVKAHNWLFGLKPAARANEFTFGGVQNLAMIIDRFDDPAQMNSVLHKVVATPTNIGAELSTNILETTSGAALPDALRDFLPTADGQLAVYMANTPKRTMLNNIAKANSMTPDEVLIYLARNKERGAASLLTVMMEKARGSTDEAAQALVRSYDAGEFKAENITSLLKTFVEEKQPYDGITYKAQLFAAAAEHVNKYAAALYGVKPDGVWTRFSNMMKSAQSAVLLGFSPTYFINNFLNNIVTMAATGVLGMRTPAQIDAFWNAFGYVPPKLRAGVGATALGSELDLNAVRAATQQPGIMNDIQQFFAERTQKVQVFSKMAQKFEQASSAQAMTKAASDFWNRLHKPGVGFDRMNPTLENALRAIDPDLPDIVYGAITGNMTRQAIEKQLWGDVIRMNAAEAAPKVAQKLGIEEAVVKEAMTHAGMFTEEFADQLSKAETPDAVRKLMADADAKAQRYLNETHAQQIENYIGNAENRVRGEGLQAAMDIFDQLSFDDAKEWFDHWQHMNEVAIKAQGIDDAKLRGDFYAAEFAKARQRWERINTRRVAQYQGISRALGWGDVTGNRVIGYLTENHELWRNFYDARDKASDTFKAKKFKNAKEASDAIWEMQVNLDDLYGEALKKELAIMQRMHDDLVSIARQQGGDIVSGAVKQWGDGIRSVREQMGKDMQAHRAKMKQTPKEQRLAAWAEFVQRNYFGHITEMFKKNTEATRKVWREATARPVKEAPEQPVLSTEPAAPAAPEAPAPKPDTRMSPLEKRFAEERKIFERADQVIAIGNEFGVDTDKAYNYVVLLNTINKAIWNDKNPDGTWINNREKYNTIYEIEPEIARQALEARARRKAAQMTLEEAPKPELTALERVKQELEDNYNKGLEHARKLTQEDRAQLPADIQAKLNRWDEIDKAILLGTESNLPDDLKTEIANAYDGIMGELASIQADPEWFKSLPNVYKKGLGTKRQNVIKAIQDIRDGVHEEKGGSDYAMIKALLPMMERVDTDLRRYADVSDYENSMNVAQAFNPADLMDDPDWFVSIAPSMERMKKKVAILDAMSKHEWGTEPKGLARDILSLVSAYVEGTPAYRLAVGLEYDARPHKAEFTGILDRFSKIMSAEDLDVTSPAYNQSLRNLLNDTTELIIRATREGASPEQVDEFSKFATEIADYFVEEPDAAAAKAAQDAESSLTTAQQLTEALPEEAPIAEPYPRNLVYTARWAALENLSDLPFVVSSWVSRGLSKNPLDYYYRASYSEANAAYTWLSKNVGKSSAGWEVFQNSEGYRLSTDAGSLVVRAPTRKGGKYQINFTVSTDRVANLIGKFGYPEEGLVFFQPARQASMFEGDMAMSDLPLGSGTAQRATESVFRPTEQVKQGVFPGMTPAETQAAKVGVTRRDIRQKIINLFLEGQEEVISKKWDAEEQADAVMAVMDARATVWGKMNNRPAAEWYGVTIADVVKSSTAPAGSLQPGLFQPAGRVDSQEFRQWFGASKVVDEGGQPLVVYHGTMRSFEKFQPGSPEGYWGDAFYFTNELGDADLYASPEGPDWKNKIDLQIDQLENIDDWYGFADDLAEVTKKKASTIEKWIDDGTVLDKLNDKQKRELAMRMLRLDNQGLVMPVYLKMENPLDMTKDANERLTYEFTEDPGTGDIIDETGTYVDMIAAIREAADELGVDADEILSEIGDDLYDEPLVKDVFNRLRESEKISYIEGEYGGDYTLLGNQFMQLVASNMGYDGVIMDAWESFGAKKKPWGVIKPMEGITPDTRHYVVFNPTSVKSVFNRGTWNPDDPRMLYQGGTQPTWYMQSERVVNSLPPGKIGVGQLTSKLVGGGVKADEMKWTGLDDFLKGKKSVDVQDVKDFLAQNRVEVQEVTKGDDTEIRRAYIKAEERLEEISGERANIMFRGNQEYARLGLGPEWKIKVIRGEIDPTKDGFDPQLWDQMKDALAREKEAINEMVRLSRLMPGKTKYEEGYTLPGAKQDYRELLLTLPNEYTSITRDYENGKIDWSEWNRRTRETPKYISTHWQEPNILAHVRFDTRTDVDGKRVLFVEEVQSDWHQTGKEQGYKTSFKEYASTPNGRKYLADEFRGQLTNRSLSETEMINALGYISLFEEGADWQDFLERPPYSLRPEAIDVLRGAVPPAPFASTWHELAMKRMLRYAAENGYDRVAWTTGEQQAIRYKESLAKVVDSFKYRKNDDGTVSIIGFKNGSNVWEMENATQNKLAGEIGKDAADMVMRGEGTPEEDGIFVIPVKDVTVGGAGMRVFYDQLLPGWASKYAKKWGARAGETRFDVGDKKAVQISPDEALRRWGNEAIRIAKEDDLSYQRPITRKELEVIVSNGGAQGFVFLRFVDDTTPVHSLDVTPQMKESVMQGQALFQDKARAAVQFLDDGRAIIHALEKPDISSIVHEIGHIFRRDLDASDLKIAEDWAGVKDGIWDRPAEEKFARGFEQYLMEGKAPIPELRSVFEKFANWLSHIYARLRGKELEKLTPQMRAVFDRLLVSNPDSHKFNIETETGRARVMQPGEQMSLFQPAGRVDSPEFRAWFGDSKVVDENGQPLVVYKGMYPYDYTKEVGNYPGPEIESINRPGTFPTFGGRDPEIKVAGFFGDIDTANDFAQIHHMASVFPVYLSIKKPYIMEAHGKKAAGYFQFGDTGFPFREAMRSGEYDGAIIKDTVDEGTIYIALYPEQIKSTYNRGTFDPNDPRILYQLEHEDGRVSAIRDDKLEAIKEQLGTVDGLQPGPDIAAMQHEGYENWKPIYAGLEDFWTDSTNNKAQVRNVSKNLDADTQKQLKQYMGRVYGQMGDEKLATLRWAEKQRNMALLNYGARSNFDTFLGNVLPYSFWYTHSAMNWALRAIDHPSWISQWARIRKLQATNDDEEGYPTRLRGKVRIPIPFLPDWTGDAVYVDPLRQLFPFEQLLAPWDREYERQVTEQRRTESTIMDMLEAQEITQEEADQALADRKGTLWERASAEARAQYGSEGYNAYDFVTSISGTYLPYQWAYNFARGTPERIGPLGVTRLVRGATAAVGMNQGRGVNIEAGLRKALGMGEWDEYEDYRVDRMLANMTAEGLLTAEDAQRAMIDRTGPAFLEAQQRVSQQAFGTTLGSPLGVDLFPEGEQEQRMLKAEYSRAWEARDAGDEQALNTFWDKYPEYEARRASLKEPEARLKTFLISEVWDAYMNAPELVQKQLTQKLGTKFQDAFLNKETRSYDSIDVETLAAWAQAFGPGAGLESMPSNEQLVSMMREGMADENTVEAYQNYSMEREARFPGISAILDKYYNLPEGEARNAYKRQHPEIGQYEVWRNRMLAQYPSIIPFAIGETNKVYYASPTIQAMYYNYLAARDQQYPAIMDTQAEYYTLPEGDARRAYKIQHPELESYWDWRRAMMQEYPDLIPYLMSTESLANLVGGQYSGSSSGGYSSGGYSTSYGGGYSSGYSSGGSYTPKSNRGPDFLTYSEVQAMEPALIIQLYAYFYGGQRLGDGALKALRWILENSGRDIDLDTYLNEIVKVNFVRQ